VERGKTRHRKRLVIHNERWFAYVHARGHGPQDAGAPKTLPGIGLI
jgi:hypothetical protein